MRLQPAFQTLRDCSTRCRLFGQDQTKADRILRNCFEGANMAPAPTRLPLLPAMPAYTMGGTDAS